VRLAKSVPKNPKVVAPDAPQGEQYWQQLHTLGLNSGLDALGVARAEVLTRAFNQITDRIERDLVNSMKFTFLRPERSTNPTALVQDARSVIVGARSYAFDDVKCEDNPGELRAHIARYAWDDHYGFLKESLNVVASQLRRDGHRATVFADDNSIVDREVAYLAGIGWFGRNANILIPGKGSMFVLGCVVTTADLPVATPVADGCGTCTRCVPGCPTGAIIEPGVIDGHRCLSWLLQKPGVFAREFRSALGTRIYGCDDCQTVCPPTKKFGSTSTTRTLSTSVDVIAWLNMGDNELNHACEGWYVDHRDMTWVRRNLLIVVGNMARPDDPRVVDIVHRYLSHPSAVLRAHATWAAARLGMQSMLFWDDPDPMVQDELANLPALREDL
jgi:epoxyqueuosine reductase